MNARKIILWIGLAVAVIGGLVAIPYAGLILLVGGLVYGLWIEADTHVRVIVTALALAAFAGAFGVVPQIGSYLSAIVGNLGALTAGAALMIIFRNIWARAKP